MADNEEGLRISLKAEVDDFIQSMQSGAKSIAAVASAAGAAVKDFLNLSSAADTTAKAEAQLNNATQETSSTIQQQSEYVKLTGVEIARMGKYYTQLSYELKSFVISAKQSAGAWQVMEAGAMEGGSAIQQQTIAISNNLRALKDEAAATQRVSDGMNEFKNELDRNKKSQNDFNYVGMGGVRVLHDLSRAFISGPGTAGFTRALTGAVNQIGSLTAVTGSIGGAFTVVKNTLMGPAGVILGLTALVEVAEHLTKEYGSLGNAIAAFVGNLDDQLKIQQELRDTLLKGRNDAVKEQVSLETLYNAARNLNIPLSERNKIVAELQRMYPEYFKNFNAEQIAAGNAQKAYDELRKSILQVAQAKAIEEQVTEQTKKLNEAKIAAVNYERALKEAQTAEKNVNQGSGPNYGSYGIVVGAGLRTSSAEKDVAENKKLQASIQSTIDALMALQKQREDSDKTAASAGVGDKDTASRISKTGESLKTVSSILETLKANIQAVKDEFSVTGGNGGKFIEKLVDQYKNAAGDLSKLGVSSDSGLFQNIKANIDQLQKQLESSPGLKPTIKIPIKADIDPNELTRVLMANNATYIGAIVKGFLPAVEKAKQKINDMVKDAAASGISSIAEAFGSALVSGNWQSVLGSFENTIASFLSQLGKLLILQGLSIQAFTDSLATLQGEGAIIAGVALVAAAGAFKAFASKGPEKFATGGTVNGPTLALIGDNPSGVEHVIPQEVLDKMGGGGGFKPGDIIAQIKGNDLVLVMARTQKQQRNNG